LLFIAALSCRGQAFEWWQSTDVALFSRGRVSSVVHTQFRMRQRFHDIFQGRIGPVMRMSIPGRWNLVLGYYFGETEESRVGWRNNHRTFAGVDHPFRFESGTLTTRTMAEHHFGGGNPQDRRFRQLFSWSHRAPLSPYGSVETFFDRHGFMNQRLQGGIRRPLTETYNLDIGYIYDIRMDRAGGHRHAIHTAIRPRR
jgi:hypothetical protein